MGEYADAIINSMIDGYHYSSRSRRRGYQSGSGNYKWRTNDGQVIDMKDMTDQHLSNALKVCKKKKNTAKEKQIREIIKERIEKRKRS